MDDEYVCQCDVCTGNVDNCEGCNKTQGASDLTDGLCSDCLAEKKASLQGEEK